MKETIIFAKLLNDEARALNGKNIDKLLANVDINRLKEHIRDFKKLDMQNLTDKELETGIDNVLAFKVDGEVKVITTLSEYTLYKAGTKFYRVRKLENTEMPNRQLKNVSAYWNPPKKYVTRYGRLNKPKESLLYTAVNPYTAVCETHLQPGDFFMLCKYEATKPLKVAWIGGNGNYSFNGIRNKNSIEYLETVRRFLVDEFTRVIPEGQEHLYRTTEMIAKKYYNSPDYVGWRYPSIKNGYEDNICFNSNQIMYNLRLVGAITGVFNEENETDPHNTKISVDYVIIGPDMDCYYQYESKKGEEYFERFFSEFRGGDDCH